MTNLLKRAAELLMPVLFVLLQAIAPAQAQPVSAKDEKAAQSVIQAQLAAFGKDQADKAFSYATPELRQSIASSEAFMAMVKNSYPVVYRQSAVVFLKPELAGKEIVQRVQMRDARGANWLAIYSLQQQKDKAWRISGCTVVEDKNLMV